MTISFERIVIAGVGLIGGSLALALRAAGFAGEIVGLGRTQANLDIALERGMVDSATRDPVTAVAGADLVVLAVPVASTAKLAAAMTPALKPGAVMTDAGSVKARVVREVSAVLPAGVHFVGAHPIAGTEDSGAAAARADLFRGARCIVTPTAASDPQAVESVRGLWEAAGCAVETMAPEAHDLALAWVSHLPHFLAFALMGRCPPDVLRYAGPSFRDATRVAASSAEMWRDISLYNAPAIDSALASISDRLEELADALRRGDGAALAEHFATARAARRRWTGGE